MKIHCVGARFYGGQVDRIEAGFVELGHTVTPYISEADLIYYNNPPFDAAIQDKERGAIKGKMIFCILDLPFHISSFDYDALGAQLAHADAICTISQYVQWQVKTRLGRDSHVVYQPIKPISALKLIGSIDRPTPNLFLHCGRRHDVNKRAALGVHALQILGVPSENLALVGGEPGIGIPPWGTYIGVLVDQNLNGVYNQCDFVLCTSALEGLCLPVAEAMACGAIPVVCRDMTTRTELLPPALFPEYEEVEPNAPSVARFIAQFINNDDRKREFKERLYAHYQSTWAWRLSGRAVAQAILNVHSSIL